MKAAETSTRKPAPIPVGAVIGGKYRIEELIAAGGMGLVYRGTHLVLEQPVAIKIVRPELSHKKDASTRFLREARNIASLKSEHVARVLDSGCIRNGPPYMVLELLEGADLRTYLQEQGELSIQRAVDWILQVCEALAEAHAKGLVHRDIKPENLFFTRLPDDTDCIKVLDFGISKRIECAESSHSEGQQIGSPHYMAPEQKTSPSHADTRADIWSLGIVLFELITGRLPFASRLESIARLRSRAGEVVALREIHPSAPAALEDVILRCLCKEPEGRYAGVRELGGALAPFGTSAARASYARICRIARAGLRDSKGPSNVPMSFVASAELDLTPGARRTGRTLAAALFASIATVAALNWKALEGAATYVGASVVTATRGMSAQSSSEDDRAMLHANLSPRDNPPSSTPEAAEPQRQISAARAK